MERSTSNTKIPDNGERALRRDRAAALSTTALLVVTLCAALWTESLHHEGPGPGWIAVLLAVTASLALLIVDSVLVSEAGSADLSLRSDLPVVAGDESEVGEQP